MSVMSVSVCVTECHEHKSLFPEYDTLHVRLEALGRAQTSDQAGHLAYIQL